MSSMARRWAVGACTLAIVMTVVGCTNSEVVSPNVGRVRLEITADPPYTGRFEFVTATIAAVRVRPVGPGNQHLGEPLLIVQQPVTKDLRSTEPALLADLPLGGGTYVLEDIVFSSLVVSENGPPGDQLLVCTDGTVDLARIGAVMPVTLDPAPTFTVTHGRTTTLHVSIDAPALVSLVESLGQHCFGEPTIPTEAQLRSVVTLE